MSPDELLRRSLARAVHLDAKILGQGRVEVSGGSRPHVVDLLERTCDCADFAARGPRCKHLLRALMAVGDPATLAALRALVPVPGRPRKATSHRGDQSHELNMGATVAAERHRGVTASSQA